MVLNLDNSENRRMIELCYRTSKTLINPIIDWTDTDVWEFHKTENIPYCEKYGDITKDFSCTGWKRIGCLGCPMATVKQREIEFHAYPKYKEAYIRAFDKMLKEREKNIGWQSGEEVFDWWLYGKSNIKIDPNQLELYLEY